MPALSIQKNFSRPDSDVVEAFVDVPTGAVCDAQNRTGGLSHKIKPITTNQKLLGTAIVVKMGPKDNLGAWAALELVQKGDILVLATGNFEDCSSVGDVYVGMAKNAGAAGIVTDGLARDVPGIDEVGIPVFSAGVSPNSPWKNGPAEVGLTASVGGVSVSSGDIVVGDQDGVVIVPQIKITEIRENLKAILQKEITLDKAIRAGTSIPGWLEETKKRLGVVYLD